MVLRNVVFSGGGFKGWAFIGTIRAIHEFGIFKDLETVTGTSAGSLFALFLVLGLDHNTLLDYFYNVDRTAFADIAIDKIFINKSVLEGKIYRKTMSDLITLKYHEDITFLELYQLTKIKFTINALNITDSKHEYFDYILSPDIKVIDAVCASSAIPVVLPPVKINNKLYYDGALCNNMVLDHIDPLDTIAFSIYCADKQDSLNPLEQLMVALVKISYQYHIKPQNDYAVIELLDQRYANEMLNITQTMDQVFDIYMHGYTNSKEIILKNVIALPAPQTVLTKVG